MLYSSSRGAGGSFRGKTWRLPNGYWRACNHEGQQCTFKIQNEASRFAQKGKPIEKPVPQQLNEGMTRNQVWASFKSEILPQIKKQYERDGVPDKPARREAWNNYVDSLAQDGQVSYKDADRWSHPRGLETESTVKEAGSLKSLVLKAIEDEAQYGNAVSTRQLASIARKSGHSTSQLKQTLSKLTKARNIEDVGGGHYELR